MCTTLEMSKDTIVIITVGIIFSSEVSHLVTVS